LNNNLLQTYWLNSPLERSTREAGGVGLSRQTSFATPFTEGEFSIWYYLE